MKIKPEQLAQHLKQPLAPIYILSGDEPLLAQEASDQIRNACLQQGMQRELYHVDASFDWGDLLQSANSLSLFSEQKMLEVRIAGKLNDAGVKALKTYKEIPASDNVLLLHFAKLEGPTKKTKWFTTLEKDTQWIEVWPIESRQMPGWLNRRLKQAGLSASQDAVEMLADRVDGNLLAASQEIEKLRLLGSDHIDVQQIEDAVCDSARFSLFTLSDAALDGDVARCLKILTHLQAEGSEPPIVLWAIIREIRALIQLAQSSNIENSFKQQRIWPKRQPSYKKALQRVSHKQLLPLLEQGFAVDQAIKGQSKENPWLLIQQMCLVLCGVNLLSNL